MIASRHFSQVENYHSCNYKNAEIWGLFGRQLATISKLHICCSSLMGGYLLIPSLSHWLSNDRSGKREQGKEADWPGSHDVEDKFSNTTQVMDEGAHKNNTTFSTTPPARTPLISFFKGVKL